MKAAPVKTGRDDSSFSIISLTECQEALSEGQFGKQTHDTLSGADVFARSVGIEPYTYWGLLLFFLFFSPQDISLDNEI